MHSTSGARTRSDAREQRDHVAVTLDAADVEFKVARSIAETTAILYDFDLDTIADLKLAVDEACAQLRAIADDNAAIHVQITPRHRWMRLHVQAKTAARQLNTTGFGWHVLRTLTDTVNTDTDTCAPAHNDGPSPGGQPSPHTATTITFTITAKPAAEH